MGNTTCFCGRTWDHQRIAELEAENERLRGELNIIERNNADHIATALDTNEALWKVEAEVKEHIQREYDQRQRARQAEAELAALKGRILNRRGMSESPCDICGYSGPGNWQPDIHHCSSRATREETP